MKIFFSKELKIALWTSFSEFSGHHGSSLVFLEELYTKRKGLEYWLASMSLNLKVTSSNLIPGQVTNDLLCVEVAPWTSLKIFGHS